MVTNLERMSENGKDRWASGLP